MSSKPNIQAIHVADKLAHEARRQGDYLASNVAWALKNQMRFGRPQVKDALARVEASQLPFIIHELRVSGANLGTAWLAVQRYVCPAGRTGVRQ